MIYLRPSPKNVPVSYVESVEKAGLVVHASEALAIYTCKVAPNSGPPGPPGTPGEDFNSKYDTIIASASDELTPITTGGPKTTFRAPYRMDLATGYVRISLTTANTGAAFIVNVTMNGASLFSTNVQIDAGMKTSVGSGTPAVLAITDIPDDAEFLVYVIQVGSSTAGTGLKVAVTGIKVDP